MRCSSSLTPESYNPHALFDRIKIKRKDGVDVPRSFGDYEVSLDDAWLAAGVTLIKRV
ncbi:MAG: hypothetical protein HZT41_14245 [Dechloromonas sp.]|nr:MAG: hypothetical protein HZT41_14245 [Dechloromonas sp.]